MKKTVAAVAVLGAFAGSALAADVTLYGVVDAGLVYTHLDQDVQGVDATDKFEMKSGNQAGSRGGRAGGRDNRGSYGNNRGGKRGSSSRRPGDGGGKRK